MMTADETQTQITLGFLDSCTDPVTGFLPSHAPLLELPTPFTEVSTACSSLTDNFHGPEKNCRKTLDTMFGDVKAEWAEALKTLPTGTLEDLFSKTSLLCHAYRLGHLPAPKPDGAPLPPGLDWLWTQTADRLDVPKIGSYYALLMNNWKSHGLTPGSAYNPATLAEGVVLPAVGWLTSPSHDDLKSYLSGVVEIESRGARMIESMKEIYGCVLRGNAQEATYHLMVLSASILAVNTAVTRSFKLRMINLDGFNANVRPMLVFSEEPDELRGASEFQGCVLQALESFFGIQEETNFGKLVLENRKYLLPQHRKLFKVMAQTSPVIRSFVESAQSTRLVEAYNRCLSLMQSWRISNQKRGALITQEERELKADTSSQSLESEWAGREWSLDFLFRFLTDEQRTQLEKNTETISYKAGDVLIQQGNLFPGLFELVSGTASVKKKVGDSEESVDKMNVGEVFGEMSLVENLPASASIVADVDLKARQVSLETVYDLINEHRDAEGGFYLALAQLISSRFRKTFRGK